MQGVDHISRLILADLLADFVARGLPASALQSQYEGPSFALLRERYAVQSAVDFDLAIAGLEKTKLIDTGPKAPYENDPYSSIAIFMIVSKYEYAYLTEAGYHEAQKQAHAATLAPKPSTSVHISGTFLNSPVGVGENIQQSVSVNVENDAELIRYLAELAEKAGTKSAAIEKDVTALIAALNNGNLKPAKPLVQKLFGAGVEAVQATAWGVLSAIIAKKLGF